MTTRRVFLSAVPAAAVGGMAWAQDRQRPVLDDPLADAIAQDLLHALQTQPSLDTLRLAAHQLATLAERTGAARRIDMLLQQPDASTLVMARLADHAAHQAERAKLLELAPNLPDVVIPAHTQAEVDQVVGHFRANGFAATLRQMADSLQTVRTITFYRNGSRVGDPIRLDWCDYASWGVCLFWYVATVWMCLSGNGAGCLVGLFIDAWVCAFFLACQP